MDNEYGNDFISIIDDDGNEFELEHLDTTEFQGDLYMAFLPANMEENDPDYGIVILKVEEVDNEEQFVTVDDEDVLNQVYEQFMRQLFDEDND